LSKFYKLPIQDRLDVVSSHVGQELDYETLRTGGLNMDLADSMIENVVGILSLPLSIVPTFVINKKKHMIPMCIEEPSVVAACSSIGKLLSSHSFFTSSTPNVMLGQVFLPNSSLSEIHQIMGEK
jgi:hydroxymethylglutaryl-CoA reductase